MVKETFTETTSDKMMGWITNFVNFCYQDPCIWTRQAGRGIKMVMAGKVLAQLWQRVFGTAPGRDQGP